MTKRVISLLLVAILAFGLLAACGKNDGPLSSEDAKKVVLQDLNTKESKVDSIDIHVTTVDNTPCYSVYISVAGQHWQYVVNGISGQILQKTQTDHAHSH